MTDRGTEFLRGQLVLVCAAPGTGKSAFALTYAVLGDIPTLYFSADSDPFIQTSRMLSIKHGWPLASSSRFIQEGRMTDELDGVPVWFNYEASPTLNDIDLELEGYAELYGEYPDLVVIDNITNVLTDQSEDDPFAGLEALMDHFHKIGRDTGSCVVCLHHVLGEYNNGQKSIPLSGVKGQITRVPELVATLHRSGSHLCVSTVKNRSGKADATGQAFCKLSFDADYMRISDVNDRT